MTLFYDLSHRIENGMTYYPGDPEPRLEPAEMEPPWRVTQLRLGTHTGTHIDAASHFILDGRTIDQYPLPRFILPGFVVPVSDREDDQPIGGESFANYLPALPEGGALIIRTGWDRFWRTGRYLRHPFLSAEAAERLVAARVGLVGIDALNVDSTARATSHAHRILLGGDVLLVENLTRLDQLTPGKAYQFSFLPLLFSALDGSPVRAVAWESTSDLT